MQTIESETRRKIINRLKRIEGQVRGMTRMVAEDEDCEKVLEQFKALNAAIRNCGRALLGYYVMQCIQEKVDTDEATTACIRQKLITILNTHL